MPLPDLDLFSLTLFVLFVPFWLILQRDNRGAAGMTVLCALYLLVYVPAGTVLNGHPPAVAILSGVIQACGYGLMVALVGCVVFCTRRLPALVRRLLQGVTRRLDQVADRFWPMPAASTADPPLRKAWRMVRRLAVLVIPFVLWWLPDLVLLVAPIFDKNVVTNLLDLVSLVLATPKLFGAESRPHMHRFALISTVLLMLWGLGLWLGRDIPDRILEINRVFAPSVHQFGLPALPEAILAKVHVMQEFEKLVYPLMTSILLINGVFVLTLLAISVLGRKLAEAELADTALIGSISIFIYSRAIAMLG